MALNNLIQRGNKRPVNVKLTITYKKPGPNPHKPKRMMLKALFIEKSTAYLGKGQDN